MPGEVRINVGRIQASKADSIRSRHKETLSQLKNLTNSIKKLEIIVEADGRIDEEMFGTLVKKFLFTVSTVPDDYFLTDVCELTHELFIEFRLILGYLQSGKPKKLKVALRDVIDMCGEITGMFREFLSEPGYNGTNFPKPGKLRAMRELAGIVADASDVTVLTKKSASEVKEVKDVKDVKDKNEFTNVKDAKNITNAIKGHITIDIFNTTDNGTSTESSEMPLTPKLYSEDVSAMRFSKGDSIVAAMGELMAPPPPPTSKHGRIVYVSKDDAKMGQLLPPPIPTRRSSTGSLRPPILIDDDGDILPASGPIPTTVRTIDNYYALDTPKGLTPRAGQAKVLEDDDSFIMAYREQALCGNSVDLGNTHHLDKRTMTEVPTSSGWSLHNRT